MTTLDDVARHVGVTSATVSNVITGKGSVSENTRLRVFAAIEELGYQPNMVARSLAQKKTLTLALIVPTIANPFYAEIAEEIERTAWGHDYHLILCNTFRDRSLGQEHLKALSRRWVDGLLIMGGSLPVEDLLAVTRSGQRRLPIVLCFPCETEERAAGLSMVDLDYRYAGELAAQHFVSLGHRRLAVIVEYPGHAPRLEGFCATLAASGIDLPPASIQYGDSTMRSGYQAAQTLLSLPTPPTALFATNDLMALGAMEAALDKGLTLPDDLSVIGLDDIMIGTHMHPPLTTIATPKHELAMQAVELLLRHIDDVQSPSLSLTVRPHLTVRQTTAPQQQDFNG
jgi:DNA-binding LacI/PurR family transcriptional regulator